jgi:tRNA(adenine34) deaminase
MAHAIRLAVRARDLGEVPVGCVIVNRENVIVAEGHNLSETRRDATQHAELVALQAAASDTMATLARGAAGAESGALRLLGCTAYVTLEPCAMCAGALVLARVERVVYGTRDPKAGAVDTLFGIGKTVALNHRFDVHEGVRQNECAALLQAFFQGLRAP